jgi:hypothetical protein
MGESESKTLCAHLTGSVGNLVGAEFYQNFNLDKDIVFSEFHFKEMMQIYHFPGMEDWPKVIPSQDSDAPTPSMYMSLVCFWCPSDKSEKSQPPLMNSKASLAHKKVQEMLCSCFDSNKDHECIKEGMAHYPTIAIFMSLHNGQDALKRNCKKKQGSAAVRKSILDVKDTTSLHCLAAVNYTALHGNDTVVLWLATTLKAPPIESTHVTWWNLGLASYLLCMLVKQHTRTDWNVKYSTLYLQASHQRDNPACRFYLKLGF